ncbi:caspase domain-containing protein [Plantactinospora solaniradicis]|uniref:Caspase domain-containing protein n=1 Tax=Plantactinospora solaniradicis TaxID=1723736 RepID=A0ABW1K4I4_9ACTN
MLIGTSTYQSADLTDLPAVRNNLDGLAAVLTAPAIGAISPDHCVVIPDPTDARTVYRALRKYAAAAEDTLLVYFAGHGRTGPRNELYLGLADTDPDELRVSALAFDLIRDVLAECPAANRVVILDCCFSGRAIQDMSGADERIFGQIGVEGTYVLASAPANAVALAPVGATYTAFTGELLNLLNTGVPGGPDLLTFGTIYRRLLHTTSTRGLPIPGQRGTGTVDLLALARNVAAGTPEKSRQPLEHSGEPGRQDVGPPTTSTPLADGAATTSARTRGNPPGRAEAEQDGSHSFDVTPVEIIFPHEAGLTLRTYTPMLDEAGTWNEVPVFLAVRGRIQLFDDHATLVHYVRANVSHDLAALPGWTSVAGSVKAANLEPDDADRYNLDLVPQNLAAGHDLWDPDLLISAGEIARDLACALSLNDVLAALAPGSLLDDLDEILRTGGVFARRRLRRFDAAEVANGWRSIIHRLSTVVDHHQHS